MSNKIISIQGFQDSTYSDVIKSKKILDVKGGFTPLLEKYYSFLKMGSLGFEPLPKWRHHPQTPIFFKLSINLSFGLILIQPTITQ